MLPPRLPSTSSSLTLTGESIRRRVSSSHSRQMDSAFSSIAEEGETVVLCPSQHQDPQSSPPLPALPEVVQDAKSPAYRAVQRGLDPPSSDPYTRRNSFCSTLTSASQIPRLPTPDFSQPDLSQLECWPSFPPGLRHGTEAHELPTSESSTHPARGAKTARETSLPNSQNAPLTVCEAEIAEGENIQTESGTSEKPPLLPSISTTSKLTRKWPAPQTVKRRMRSRQPQDALGLAALELAEGLGVDRPERWTKHKWCLFFSVCTMYAYGGAGLVCAILTWFRGKSHELIVTRSSPHYSDIAGFW
jgi:hypothetical protein